MVIFDCEVAGRTEEPGVWVAYLQVRHGEGDVRGTEGIDAAKKQVDSNLWRVAKLVYGSGRLLNPFVAGREDCGYASLVTGMAFDGAFTEAVILLGDSASERLGKGQLHITVVIRTAVNVGGVLLVANALLCVWVADQKLAGIGVMVRVRTMAGERVRFRIAVREKRVFQEDASRFIAGDATGAESDSLRAVRLGAYPLSDDDATKGSVGIVSHLGPRVSGTYIG
jgi:hypothetical protein